MSKWLCLFLQLSATLIPWPDLLPSWTELVDLALASDHLKLKAQPIRARVTSERNGGHKVANMQVSQRFRDSRFRCSPGCWRPIQSTGYATGRPRPHGNGSAQNRIRRKDRPAKRGWARLEIRMERTEEKGLKNQRKGPRQFADSPQRNALRPLDIRNGWSFEIVEERGTGVPTQSLHTVMLLT